jgi:poly(3-hydroxybutyrate) depolymerase
VTVFHLTRLVSAALLLVVIGLGTDVGAKADEKIAVGLGSFPFTPDAKRPQQSLKVWTSRPETFGPNSPIVFVMHGVKRNGQTYRDTWAPYSVRDSFLLLVPEFSDDQYPSEAYSQGNIADKKGNPLDPNAWTFTIIERLFDQAKRMTGNHSEQYYLYGHSAGGQFVHRFVLFMPKARYARAIAANPGYYTIPTQAEHYPYGLRGTHVKGSIDPAVFERDFVLMLGAQDTDRNDPNLRKTPKADAQGLTRLDRGMHYFKTVQSLAQREKAKFNWKMVTVPDVGHFDPKMSESASKVLFRK